MDSLSRLIQLVRPKASLELRCMFEGAFSVEHDPEPQGTVPFHLVLSGSCTVRTSDSQFLKLEAGDFVLFPRGGAHGICDKDQLNIKPLPFSTTSDGLLPLRRNGFGQADVDLLCGRFICEKGPVTSLFATLPDPMHISLTKSQSIQSLQTLVSLMRSEADQHNPGAYAIVTALSQALFAMALRIYGENHREVPSILTLLSDPRLSTSIQALLAEPGHNWTIAELGDRAAMSRATYARHFSATAGVTVSEFLNQIRMATACELLVKTKRSAGDIGLEVGYQSEAAFGKAFRLFTGLTPGRYRVQEES